MIGVYDNFPAIRHGAVIFSCKSETLELQKTILFLLQSLNEQNEPLKLPEFAKKNIHVKMDVGVADGITFNYFDLECLKCCLKEVSNNALHTLDLFFIIRYYLINGAKSRPLKFDYYIIRFLFRENTVELLVYHDKGPRHLAVEEMIKFLFNKINHELQSKQMSPLILVSIRTVGSDELGGDDWLKL
ncbi:hypothetical protein KEJ33_05050 [Candidatus Bathyarchaeota archaeon]|nr:hypothetical protein [Candidatus Bathyarchaeota archaeon]